nr:MAG TPA: adenine-specific methyltransferase [Caudoviricetes sp.]
MREYPDQHFDAVITDPPYGIAFLGEKWDTATPHGFQAWAQSWGEEALRVIKPGGYLLAFSAPRTYHRLTSGLEDAGFEIRDAMAWIRADGKPAGMDVAASIDRGALQTRETHLRFTSWLRSTGITCKQINQATNSFMGSHYLTQAKQPAIPTRAHWDAMLPLLEGTRIPDWVTDLVNDTVNANVLKEREGRDVRAINTDGTATNMASREVKNAGAPIREEAKAWAGWGLGLKPAWEPIIVARRPVEGASTTANVVKHGVGALNIQAASAWNDDLYPPNLLMGEQALTAAVEQGAPDHVWPVFRYQPKAPTSERPKVGGVQHVTVKPLELMRYLVRLVVKPGSLILEPFAGSGTTLQAAAMENTRAVGCELDDRYIPLIRERFRHGIEATLDLFTLGDDAA